MVKNFREQSFEIILLVDIHFTGKAAVCTKLVMEPYAHKQKAPEFLHPGNDMCKDSM
jgi:hypothetical protein